MSSNNNVRSRSLDSGVTPRRLYQVVLPDPGRPMARTTYPLGDFNAVCSAGGVPSDSGCVSMTILGSVGDAGVNASAGGASITGSTGCSVAVDVDSAARA